MSSTAPYVSVTISRETSNPKQAEFDRLVLVTTGAGFDPGEFYRVYASATEAEADVDLDEVAIAMVSAVFSQDEHPETVIVASLPTPADETLYRLTPVAGSLSIGVTVVSPSGVETVIASTGANAGAALADFVADLEAVAGLGCTSDSGAALVEPDGFGEHWRFKDFVNVARFVDESPDLGFDDALTALRVNGLDFYGVEIDVNSAANIQAVAAWALANKRVFIAAPEVLDPADYTPTALAMRSASNDRVLSLVKRAGRNEFAGCALAGLMRAKQPGSATYMYKTLRGVSTDPWTSTQRTAFVAANCVLYMDIAGLAKTTEGFTAVGEYLDVIEGLDWVVARMEERIFRVLASKDKVPFTDGGIALVASQVESVQLDAEAPEVGIFETGSSSTSIPKKSSIPTADRAARRLTRLTFASVLAGAIHYAEVRGSVTV